MIFSPYALGQQIALLLSLLLALTLATAYLWRRGRLPSVRALAVPLALSVVFGTLDGLVTLGGTYYDPYLESNWALRAVLLWGGWWGLCLWAMLWVFAWTLVLDGLESLRLRLAGSGAKALLRGAQLYLFYTLPLLHLTGVARWIDQPALLHQIAIQIHGWLADHAPGLVVDNPLGESLYIGLFFGALGTILHAGGVAAARTLRELARQHVKVSQ